MMRNFLLLIALTFSFGAFTQVIGQNENISIDQTLAYINGKMNGAYTLKNKSGKLVVDVFKNGKVNRTDEVPFEDLNPENAYYAPDEKAIVVRCIANDCIDRRFAGTKGRGQFSRINFAGDFDVKTQNGLLNAFEHLIKLFQDNNYKSNKPFEE